MGFCMILKCYKKVCLNFLFLPWRHYFRWRQHFCRWRHQKSDKTKNPITIEPLIVWKWLTPRCKGIIRPLSKNEDWLTHYAYLLMTSALFQQKFQKWRHVTLFLKYLPKNCWRHQKIGTMGQSLLIFRMRPHNTFPTRGQPLSYDKRFTSYRIFTGYRFLSDFWWRHHEKCWYRQK